MASAKKNTQAASKKADNDADKNTASTKKKGTQRAKSSNRGKTDTKAPHKTQKSSKRKPSASRASILARSILLAAMILCSAFVLLFDVDTVNTVAMQPTLNKGDLVLSWAPVFIKPKLEEGQVYLLKVNPKSKTPNFMRAIACNGQTVSYKEDILKLNGKPIERLPLTNDAITRPKDEPEIWRESLANGTSWRVMIPQNPIIGGETGTLTPEPGACFMAGDNRMSSFDSRHIGAIKQEDTVGRAMFIIKSSKSDGLIGSFLKFL